MSIRQPREGMQPIAGRDPGPLADLSDTLQEAITERLFPDEVVQWAGTGNPREVLVVTDRRLLLTREPVVGGRAPEVIAVPRAGLTFALEERPGGARLNWSPAPEGAPGGFNVPFYERPRFERLLALLTAPPPSPPIPNAATAPATGGNPGEAPAPASLPCSRCGAGLLPEAAWCVACGLQVRDTCWTCGLVLAREWRICPACGTHAGEPGEAVCPSCNAPAARGHGYCVRCGAPVRPMCDSCDRVLRREWQFCPSCGAAAPRPEGKDGRESARLAGPPDPPAPPVGSLLPPPRAADAERLNRAGAAAYEEGHLDEAIGLFRRATQADPTRTDYWVNLGVALLEKSLDLEAFAAFQRALELDPGDVQALLHIGNVYMERERREDARQAYEQVIALAPDSDEAQEARENLEHLDEL